MPFNCIAVSKDTINDYIYSERKSRENHAGAYRVNPRQNNTPVLSAGFYDDIFYVDFCKEYQKLPEYITNHLTEEDYTRYHDEVKSICLTASNKKKELATLLLQCPYYGYQEWFMYKNQMIFSYVFENCVWKAPSYISWTIGLIAFFGVTFLFSFGVCCLPLVYLIGYFLDYPKGCENEIQWFSELYLKYPHLDQFSIDNALKEQLDQLLTNIQNEHETIFGTVNTCNLDDEVASNDSYGSGGVVHHHSHYARHFDMFRLCLTSSSDPSTTSPQFSLAISQV